MIKKINSFIKTCLDWNDRPHSFLKIFQILFYYLPAFLTPIIIIMLVIQNENYILLVYFIPLVVFIVGIFIVRAKEIWEKINATQKFFIIPALGHYLKTSFEVYAIMVLLMPLAILPWTLGLDAGMGFEIPIIYNLYDITASNESEFLNFFLLSLTSTVYGYFVLFVGKFLCESFIAIAYIANNIKK